MPAPNRGSGHRRADPVTFADQVRAWAALRRGEPVSTIASRLMRPAPQVRAILWGEA